MEYYCYVTWPNQQINKRTITKHTKISWVIGVASGNTNFQNKARKIERVECAWRKEAELRGATCVSLFFLGSHFSHLDNYLLQMSYSELKITWWKEQDRWNLRREINPRHNNQTCWCYLLPFQSSDNFRIIFFHNLSTQ